MSAVGASWRDGRGSGDVSIGSTDGSSKAEKMAAMQAIDPCSLRKPHAPSASASYPHSNPSLSLPSPTLAPIPFTSLPSPVIPAIILPAFQSGDIFTLATNPPPPPTSTPPRSVSPRTRANGVAAESRIGSGEVAIRLQSGSQSLLNVDRIARPSSNISDSDRKGNVERRGKISNLKESGIGDGCEIAKESGGYAANVEEYDDGEFREEFPGKFREEFPEEFPEELHQEESYDQLNSNEDMDKEGKAEADDGGDMTYETVVASTGFRDDPNAEITNTEGEELQRPDTDSKPTTEWDEDVAGVPTKMKAAELNEDISDLSADVAARIEHGARGLEQSDGRDAGEGNGAVRSAEPVGYPLAGGRRGESLDERGQGGIGGRDARSEGVGGGAVAGEKHPGESKHHKEKHKKKKEKAFVAAGGSSATHSKKKLTGLVEKWQKVQEDVNKRVAEELEKRKELVDD